MRILILEDDAKRHKQFKMNFIGHVLTIVETAHECIEALVKEKFDALFLDHDLGGEQMVASGKGTGYEVALWLSKHIDYAPKEIYVHSLNIPGALNMINVLSGVGIYAVRAPFLWLNKQKGAHGED